MARNTNPWFKLHYRDWLESERIMGMSLAAEGLYARILFLQAQRGSVPADLQKLSMLLLKNHDDVVEVWHEVAPHFIEEVVDGETRLYNRKQRELLKADAAKSKNYSKANKGKRGTNTEQICTKLETNSKQNTSLRASVSASVSVSASLKAKFDSFWLVYPKKKQRQTAFESWMKVVTSDDMANAIIAHVEQRAKSDVDWLRESGQFIPYGSTFLNQRRWEDEYSTTVSTPARGIPSQRYQREEPQGFEYDILGVGDYTMPKGGDA